MSATKALTRSRKRRAVAERPSRPGNKSLWFVTAERAREGSSHKGDDVASMLGRSRNSNLFHQGVAKESDDPDVVAATMAKPGVVLRRPVGSDKPFSEQADLPTHLSNAEPKHGPMRAGAKPNDALKG